jgi:large subunit ribosomal protein L30
MAQRNLRIQLVKSVIGSDARQRETVRSLGLRRIQQVVEVPDNEASRGMVFKVKHLVRVLEAAES